MNNSEIRGTSQPQNGKWRHYPLNECAAYLLPYTQAISYSCQLTGTVFPFFFSHLIPAVHLYASNSVKFLKSKA